MKINVMACSYLFMVKEFNFIFLYYLFKKVLSTYLLLFQFLIVVTQNIIIVYFYLLVECPLFLSPFLSPKWQTKPPSESLLILVPFVLLVKGSINYL